MKGGAAFPRPTVQVPYQNGHYDFYEGQDGMSLRQYYAGQALSGLLSSYTGDNLPNATTAAALALEFADALVKASEEGT